MGAASSIQLTEAEDALKQAKTVLREHRAESPGADPKVLAAAIEDTQVYREQVMRASTM